MTPATDPATASSPPAWKRVLTIVVPLLILSLALHGLALSLTPTSFSNMTPVTPLAADVLNHVRFLGGTAFSHGFVSFL